ncbi:MAG: HesA/MoeB/ThiF family protein [Flavobacteriales bacterium]|jgi:adenylyltransferase/sulfurtransferase|nr:HesA/MoeB/ThiF family protein [Flavobacteriales bacterium]
MLTNQEKNRYDRHIKLEEIGELGQERLKTAKVLVVGAGGLGCPVLQYLVAAGVGRIGLVDGDRVSESNLQRQILYTNQDVGQLKVDAAVERLSQQNALIQFDKYQEWLHVENALTIIEKYDVIVDGTDNFSTRYLINDACVLLNKPFVYASIFKFEGQLSVFNYQNGPSYRCLFPEPPKANQLPNCSEVGVLGVLPGVLGTFQANEVLKMILQIGTVLSGKLKVIDLLGGGVTTLQVNRNTKSIEAVLKKGLLQDYDVFCNVANGNNHQELELEDALALVNDANYVFLDVRETWEQPRIEKLNAIEIAIDDLEEAYESIPKNKNVVVFCQTGGRSQQAIHFLNKNYGFDKLINLKGGVLNYSI